MKKIIVFVMCVFSTFGYSKNISAKKELLADIKSETKKCAVQFIDSSVDNGKVLGFKSVCTSLVIISENEAHILIDGEWLIAKISESKESDGGDLDDLVISDAKGKVLAKKSNIPAYDNIIVAMAGDSDFGAKEESQK